MGAIDVAERPGTPVPENRRFEIPLIKIFRFPMPLTEIPRLALVNALRICPETIVGVKLLATGIGMTPAGTPPPKSNCIRTVVIPISNRISCPTGISAAAGASRRNELVLTSEIS
jgi:hypothetical protein